MTDKSTRNPGNVISLFTRTPWHPEKTGRIIRLSPEPDDLSMLYSNDSDESRLLGIKILGWALSCDGTVDALIPWLDKLHRCRDLNDPLNGHWEGYFDNARKRAFFDPPDYRVRELKSAARYFGHNHCGDIIQEIPDNIGTHAIFSPDNFQTMTLMQVISWQLTTSGEVLAMVADSENITRTPVLPGDDCLYPAQSRSDFRYFFHHDVANKFKNKAEATLRAFAALPGLEQDEAPPGPHTPAE